MTEYLLLAHQVEGSFDAMVRAIERAAGLRRRADGALPVHRKAGSAKRHCPPQAVPQAVPQVVPQVVPQDKPESNTDTRAPG